MSKIDNIQNNTPAQVLMLGTFHFAYAPGHAINLETADITTIKKQTEIMEVVAALEKFKPNKIAVEVVHSLSEELNNSYLKYCSQENDLDCKEIHHRKEIAQLGFRLGKRLNHPKIYPIDVKVPLPEEWVEYAEKHVPEFYERFQKDLVKIKEENDNLQKNATIREILRHYNTPEWNSDNHSLYIDTAVIGAGDTYDGAKYLLAWYERNIGILANLQKITEPRDRILIIYGAGHAAILNELIGNCSNMKLVDPLDYL